MNIQALSAGVYVLAVSGGVDSVVMLDILARSRTPNQTLIVAHLNHGIRPDAIYDQKLVRSLARVHNLLFETKTVTLGEDASEQKARQVRYDFLYEILAKYNATALVTAHHRDDVIETAVLNIMRGTGWRGIASLRSTSVLQRPLLNVSKKEIIAYAVTHSLEWHEDSTNNNQTYLRNTIRHKILPLVHQANPDFMMYFYQLISNQQHLRHTIEPLIEIVTQQVANNNEIIISKYKRLPDAVRQEVIRQFLKTHQLYLTRPQHMRLDDFISRAHRNQKHSLGTGCFAARREGRLVVEKSENMV
jgi:tRNA(Ile)-lysidine synthetase-like protein